MGACLFAGRPKVVDSRRNAFKLNSALGGEATMFETRSSFEKWFEKLPDHFSSALAARAALRTLPIVVHSVVTNSVPLTRLISIFRAALLISANATWPDQRQRYLDVAVMKEIDDISRQFSIRNQSGYFALRALAFALGTINSKNGPELSANRSALRALDATEDGTKLISHPVWGANAKANKADFDQIEVFLQAFESHPKDFMSRPLWEQGAPVELVNSWDFVKQTLQSAKSQKSAPSGIGYWKEFTDLMPISQSWSVWSNWYDDRISGFENPNRLLCKELEFAWIQLPDEEWMHKNNPAHLNNRLSELERHFREAPPLREHDDEETENTSLDFVFEGPAEDHLKDDGTAREIFQETGIRTQRRIDEQIQHSDLEIRDFFISYSSDTEDAVARRIANILNSMGYSCHVQFQDCLEGMNFLSWMNVALANSDRFIALYSPDYWASEFCEIEWNTALKRDPTGFKRILTGFVVRACTLPPLAESVVYRNLVGLTVDQERKAILDAIRGPERPTNKASVARAATSGSSPLANINENKLGATPNPALDQPVMDIDMRDLPDLLIDICETLIRGAPRNCPEIMRHDIESYSKHLADRSTQCSVNLLKLKAQRIEAEFDGEDREIWRGGALEKAARQFCEHHSLLVTHYPLAETREQEMAATPVKIEEVKSPEIVEAVGDALKGSKRLKDAGYMLASYDEVIADIEENFANMSAYSQTMESGESGNLRAGRRKRFVLTTLGFFQSSHDALLESQALRNTPEGRDFAEALSKAVAALTALIDLDD